MKFESLATPRGQKMRLIGSVIRLATGIVAIAISSFAIAQDVVATGYFVDSVDGDDSNAGTSPETPWKTLGKVSTSIKATGADVWLLEGSTFNGQTVKVSWSGTADNPVTIGTYHLVSSRPIVGSLSKPATIKGTYDAKCSQTLGASSGSKCAFNTAAAVPSSQYDPLINVEANYVTIQDLFITQSAGVGIGISGFDHLTVDNVRFHITASLAIFPRDVKYLTVRNSEFSYTAIASSRGDGLYDGGPHAISIQQSRPSYALVENNYFHELFGEAVNCRTSTFCVIRGNRIANVKNTGIYIDNTSDAIVENNEIYGTTFRAPSTTPGPAWNSGSTGIYVGLEPTSNPNFNTVRNVVRNNLIANVGDCISINVFPEREAAGWKTGGQIIGNTCLAFSAKAVDMNDPEANVAGWEIANNIFDLPNNGGASVCSSTVTSKMNFHHNAWGVAPTSEACRGPGDVVGPSGVSEVFDWTRAGQGHFPALSDWALGTGSVATGKGAPMTSTHVASAGSFLQFSSMSGAQRDGGSCSPSATEWQMELGVDILCRPRDTSRPNIGALESGAVGPKPSYLLSVE